MELQKFILPVTENHRSTDSDKPIVESDLNMFLVQAINIVQVQSGCEPLMAKTRVIPLAEKKKKISEWTTIHGMR